MKEKELFKQGLKDGMPIGLGYLSVSIGIGIAAISGGLHIITALLMSMTNLTSAGQAAGIALIAAGGSLVEMAMVQFVINLRYSLMAITLSQTLDESFTTGKRLLLGAFITDEIFAVAASRSSVNTRYMYGLIIVPYIGWALGTFIGGTLGTVLPASVTLALSMAIYGMFVAICVPAMKKSKGTVYAVSVAACISLLLRLLPCFQFIGYGFTVIIASVIGAAVSAYLTVRGHIKQ